MALQYIDRRSIFHATSLLATGVPSEYAYHFALADVMRRIAANTGWGLTCEARNTSASSADRRSRLDICLYTNGTRYGFELMAHGDDLRRHLDTASRYARVMALNGVLIVNFCVEAPEPFPFPSIEDTRVQLIHVLMGETGDAIVVTRDGDRLRMPVGDDSVVAGGAGGSGRRAATASLTGTRARTLHFDLNGVVFSVGADASTADFLAAAASCLDGVSPDQLDLRTLRGSSLIRPETPVTTAVDLLATVGIVVTTKTTAAGGGAAGTAEQRPVTLLN